MNIIVMPVGMLGTNCYLLSSKDGSCAVIDPGAQPQKIIDKIEEQKLGVKYVLLTHGHHDHIGGVKKLLEQYPEARLCVGKNDLELLSDPAKSMAFTRHDNADDFIIQNAQTLEENAELKLGELKIRVIETPGHTRGGVCYICRDALFSGDTLFYEDCGRCDLYGGSYDVMLKSLRKLADLEDDYTVYPGHGESTTMQHERKHNRYIAESYR